MLEEDRYFLVGLNLVPGLGGVRLGRLLQALGTPAQVWRAGPDAWRSVYGIGSQLWAAFSRLSEQDIDRELAAARKAGATILTWDDPGYPPALLASAGMPPVLYVRGEIVPEDDPAVAVVGTRRASRSGTRVAFRLAGELADAGVTVVSGLALGIDAAAHTGALEAGGRTLAVLGCGMDVTYPPGNAALAKRIPDQGAVLTAFPCGTPPIAENFPARNQIVAAMTWGTVVVEAGDKSGALITARLAGEAGREVFAVPGDVERWHSKGPHALIRDGATLVTCAAEILAEFSWWRGSWDHATVSRSEPAAAGEGAAGLADPAAMVWNEFLSGETLHIDDLVAQTKLPPATVLGLLARWEIEGALEQAAPGCFRRLSGNESDARHGGAGLQGETEQL